MAIRTTALDGVRAEEPWCDHTEPGNDRPCRKDGIAVGAPGPDGRTPFVCTAGHHFLWPRPLAAPGGGGATPAG